MTTELPDHAARQAMVDAVAELQYVSLVTFRKSGVGVASPVWIARDGTDLVVISVDGTGKTKRLARTARVELRPCDIRGNVPEGAPTWSGRAHLVRDEAGVAAVKDAIGRKYRMARVGNAASRATGGLLQRKPRAGIRITLDA